MQKRMDVIKNVILETTGLLVFFSENELKKKKAKVVQETNRKR